MSKPPPLSLGRAPHMSPTHPSEAFSKSDNFSVTLKNTQKNMCSIYRLRTYI